MSGLSSSLLNFGASLSTTRTHRRLQNKRSVLPAQESTFSDLIKNFASTVFGKENGIEKNLPYGSFQTQVPLRTYEDIWPYVARMKKGESGVLWPGVCSLFTQSAGTTTGRKKLLPLTDDLLAHFRKAGMDSLFYYTSRVGHAGVFSGKHLLVGASTRLQPIEDAKPAEAYSGELTGIAAHNLPPWVENRLYEPGHDIAQIEDWNEKLTALADRTVGRDVSLIAGLANWLKPVAQAVLSRAAHGKIRPTYLKAVWPNLECVVHGGVPFGPFADELRAFVGPKVHFHEIYPASEAFIATQDGDATFGLRLMTDAGIFFEFAPIAGFDEVRLNQMSSRTLPLAAVREGVDYAVIISTPGGLCRYVLGDVVRFISVDPPRLIYVGRTKLQLSAFGENVIEKELTDALLAVCQHYNWTIVNFHVAPLFGENNLGKQRGRHEWWIELKTPTVITPTGPVIAKELDAELQRINHHYQSSRSSRTLEAPMVRLVMPGIFEQWMRSAGQWGGQGKMPRCRNDRQLADELAGLARFSADE